LLPFLPCQHFSCVSTAPCAMPSLLTAIYRSTLHSHRHSQNYKEIKKTLINLLKPTGYVMHHQFNIQQLHVMPTLYLCVLYLSENKERFVPLTA
jgi:hypothetical protein